MPREIRGDGRSLNLKYETKKESLENPRYGSYLPKCFPYKIKLSPADAGQLIGWMVERVEVEIGGGGLCYAVTSHPMTADEWVYLWLSRGAAAALVQEDLISEASIEETIQGGR